MKNKKTQEYTKNTQENIFCINDKYCLEVKSGDKNLNINSIRILVIMTLYINNNIFMITIKYTNTIGKSLKYFESINNTHQNPTNLKTRIYHRI